jgi:hypothetical protein
MTVAEKRQRIRDYCKDKVCDYDDCPLFHLPENGCYDEGIVSDEIVERNYNILFGDTE